MQQKYISLLILIIIAFVFLDCSEGNKSEKTEDKTILTVTIDPQRYFLEQIAGDNFTINTLVPPGTSPETYEPAPSVMVDMNKSKLYFMIGDLGFEKVWSKRLAENNPNIKIIDCSRDLSLIEGVEHNHTDDHGHSHSHGGLDPHIWSSPAAVKEMTQIMLNSIIEFDPENVETYLLNYSNFIKRVDSTDSIIKELLADIPTRSFIVFHPSLGYFAQQYNLNQHSIEFEGKNPSPSQIRMLIDDAGKENIKTVFIQRGFDEKNAEVVAKEIGADIFEIDPLSYEWDTELIKIAEILARDKAKD
ncbi:MAG: zinc ABC transporter substrate-binding protein [Fermentimonas sp.]|nr:zinc ABC transporter substrate-binding protein [Fermentimonas sp.]